MSRRGLLLFAAMCVIWGIPYLFIRIAVHEISPAVLVFMRTGVATLILLPLAISRGNLRGIGRRWPWIVVFAAVEVGVPWFFLSSAEQHLSSALTGLLISAVPLVSLVIALLFGNRQQIGPVNLVGLLLGLVGVACIVGFDLRASDWTALVALGIVVVGYSLGPAILARYLSGVPSVAVNGLALALCCVVYAPVAIVQWPHAVSLAVVGSIAVLAVICTALAFLLFFALIAEVGPVRATVITYVNPAVAAVLGVLVLGESLTPGMLFGFALVLAGSALATRLPGRSPEGPMIPVAEDPGRVGEGVPR
ncbi:MAG TPA: DMT family transporter [Candidatus Dormibacteraeota bacterium]|nr:DMT family transporter [Candidatus Dormibacteraeota bacterium]